MATPTYSTKDIALHIENLLGRNMVARIPSADWDQLNAFAEYLVELHGLAMRNTSAGVFKLREYQNALQEYDAHVKNFMHTATVFAERESPVLADLFGDNRHVSPFYMLFHTAKMTLLFSVLVKIYYSFIKDYEGDDPKAEVIGNQTTLQSFVSNA